MKVYLFYTKQRRSVLDIDFESLIKNSKANIPNKKNLLNLLTIKSPKGNAKEKSINLTAQQNFQRYGDLVINIALFNSLKKDPYEYFKDRSNYFYLGDDEDLERLKKFINEVKEEKFTSGTQITTTSEIKTIIELENKYPDIYKEYNLENFSSFSYMEQGRILKEVSSRINSLFDICPYLAISKSAASKRIKAYKLLLRFPNDSELVKSLSCRCLEAFPSERKEQEKIIEIIKSEKNSNISRDYIINLRESLDLNDSERKLNQNIEVLKKALEPKKIRSLSKKEVDKINKYFDGINKILEDNNIIEKGDNI